MLWVRMQSPGQLDLVPKPVAFSVTLGKPLTHRGDLLDWRRGLIIVPPPGGAMRSAFVQAKHSTVPGSEHGRGCAGDIAITVKVMTGR